jgi:hydroxymethylpyrimidine/phosphomethylpyrimidine kinase
VVTGGHGSEAVDWLYDGRRHVPIAVDRYADEATHGAGCTHSAALTAFLARGKTLEEAARAAAQVASDAVRSGLADIGAGSGPVDVFGLETPVRAR